MPALIVRWDHQNGQSGGIKTREYPIDTTLKIQTSRQGYATLLRMDRGLWLQELTTPGEIFIQTRVF
ncbi:MAG: hypothetical protein LUO93_02380 [Methanomicrobiales archaeon]|nr:hypothetical protein [Methanomicrobiales archaeon]